ncbi:hypothetical protein [Nocardioides sp.]|uniref:hypothetical protein n=1 Tax=Nocardioides sp. TaxID=35761 RepID=UPI0027346B35|nr:hypothetical protein [Nocardioides sp.]MDP3893836.1 hypothetical protein [Nocardioides sp.]
MSFLDPVRDYIDRITDTETPSPWNPPDWIPPDHPAGYGEPHPPAGGEFAAEAQDLVNAANAWEDVSTTLQSVWGMIQEGWGYPGLFGAFDVLHISGTLHMRINEDLVNAAADGHWVTQALSYGLIETANDFSGTDQTQGDNFRVLENRA